MHSPTFSIIIPTYNHAHLIRRCIDSLIKQSYPNWEAIIINNFSEDDTINIVESYQDSRIKLINFRNNGIIAAARNEGIRNASADFIAFLDSDDWWDPEKLAAVKEVVGQYDVIYHALKIVRSTNKKPIYGKHLQTRHLKAPVYKDLLIKGNCIPNSASVLRKDLLLELGGLSENKEIVALEDYDLWLRIAKNSDRFLYLPQSLGYYWIGENNTTQASEKQIKRLEAIYEKHLSGLSGQDVKAVIGIKNYNIARIKEKMGHFDQAIKLYIASLKVKNSRINLKSILCILNCAFKYAKQKVA